MTDTFTWAPRLGSGSQVTLRTRKAQFGDGYVQEVADGLNNKVQQWPLSFIGPASDMQQIVDFFDAHAGYKSFYWTPPLGSQGLYRVGTYGVSPQGNGNHVVNATFQQVFAP